jgi:DNA-binding NarL/FixJ family response regulator
MSVFVADDHEVVRRGLRAWLDRFPDLVWAGEAANEQDLLEQARSALWHAVILDLSFPGFDDGRILTTLRSIQPRARICVYTMWPRGQYAARCLELGACAYIEKSDPLSDLARALRGDLPVPSTLPHGMLSERERRIVSLLLKGATPSEIANHLGSARTTISSHLRSIRTKLGVRSVPEILRYAHLHGLDEG